MARSLSGDLVVTDDVPGAFAAALLSAISERSGGRCSVALSGGDTARACYERLAVEASQETARIDWRSVDFYWGDERCVGCHDPQSNQRLARESLLSKLRGVGAVFPMACSSMPGGGLCPASYQLLVERVGMLDIVHLGMGPDGHTASLFGQSPALDAPEECLVTETEDPSGRVPYRRITLTLSAISRARLVIFTVAGAAKRDAFDSLLHGADLPASRVRARRILWIADSEAYPATG